MSFNPFKDFKNFVNKSADAVSDTVSKNYDKVSSEVYTLITPIVKTVKPNIQTTPEKPKTPLKPAPEQIQSVKPVKPNNNLDNLSPFEKKYQSLYVGCYSDDPTNPSMDTFLGQISNISECIDMGRDQDFKYVGIREGNQCFASNTIPQTQSVNRAQYCNVGCDDIGTGNCGGFYYNQVYKTTIPNVLPKLNDLPNDLNKIEHEQEFDKLTSTSNAINILENFISSDTDMKKITMGLNSDNFNCWKPVDTYTIFFWLVILIFIIYLLFEYLYKKNKEKLI